MTNSVWVIDDDRSIRWVLEKALRKAGMAVRCFTNADEVLDALREADEPDAVISDIRMPGMDGLTLLSHINETYPDLPVIIMTAHSDLDSAVNAFHGGAFEYLAKPFDVQEVIDQVTKACRRHAETTAAQVSDKSLGDSDIIGEAPAMQEVFRAIGRLSRSNITVLINGESGTGKELVAHALHQHSPRADRPFIALNTAAIPAELLESELFGHEKGAFTGATNRRRGRFEQADGGTLFLDEIGDMPAELQTRFLRVLAEGEFYPVGGRESIRVDVRIIAATHQNLEELVRAGRFREDLFHRLNVIRIHLPALRERKADIPLLMEHFLGQAADELKVEKQFLADDAMEFLMRLQWPGNVRQLQNTARWLAVMASGRRIHLDDLPPELLDKAAESGIVGDSWTDALRCWLEQQLRNGRRGLLDEALPAFERVAIDVALGFTGGRKQEAARLLGWGRNTLTRKLKELDIQA